MVSFKGQYEPFYDILINIYLCSYLIYIYIFFLIVLSGIYSAEGILRFRCCNDTIEADVPLAVELYQWYSVCVSLSIKLRSYEIWINGKQTIGTLPKSGDTSAYRRLRAGGALVIGQDQDQYLGGYNKEQSIKGKLADLRIYTALLRSVAMANYTNCRDADMSEEKLVFDLTPTESRNLTLSNALLGNIVIDDTLCQKMTGQDIIFPQVRTFMENMKLCSSLGGSLKVPQSSMDNEALFNRARDYLSKCPTQYSDFLWLGIVYSHLKGELIHYSKLTTLTYSKLNPSKVVYPNQLDTCGTFNGSPFDSKKNFGSWETRLCNDTRCGLCHFPKINFITLRGLCKNSLLDSKYFIYNNNNEGNETTILQGEYYSKIHLIKEIYEGRYQECWQITRYDAPEVRATTPRVHDDQYPIGLSSWWVENDNCDQQGSLRLKLTSCRGGEYTCDDGSCVPVIQRCDSKVGGGVWGRVIIFFPSFFFYFT